MTLKQCEIYLELSDKIALEDMDPVMKGYVMESKKAYVELMHHQAIYQVEKGGHKGAYKTHVYVNGKRKAIERSSMDAMIDALCDFYRKRANEKTTLREGLELLLKRKLDKGRQISTVKNNRNTFDRFTSEELARKTLCTITDEDIYSSIRRALQTITPSLADIRAYLQIINGIYDLAGSMGITARNPAVYIKATDFKDAVAFKRSAEERVFSPEEVNKILAYMQENEQNPHAVAIEIAIFTGMRSGEIPCLRWSDIEDGYIHVHRSIQITYDDEGHRGFREIPCTKDEKGIPRGGRYVPILPGLQSLFDRVGLAQQLAHLDTDFIVCTHDNVQINKKTLERYFNRVCKTLGMTATGIHSLRRAFATNVLLPLGLTATERAGILGHSPEVDERYYLVAGNRNDVAKQKLLEGFGRVSA